MANRVNYNCFSLQQSIKDSLNDFQRNIVQAFFFHRLIADHFLTNNSVFCLSSTLIKSTIKCGLAFI